MSIIESSTVLMSNFKEKAPGTHRHCLNVAQMGESVAKEMDLDVDNFVIAATLHDIGKCFAPLNFIENQAGVNIHDKLDPCVSYQLISRHVSDSVLVLVQLGVPLPIINIVSEHHGNSLIKTIHNKAKALNSGFYNEDDFRYRSRVPTTPESCLLMICDVVESASRALFVNNKFDDAKIIVDKIINELVECQQLDMLTIGKIRVIKRQLYRELDSIYHKRLDYDEEPENVVVSGE